MPDYDDPGWVPAEFQPLYAAHLAAGMTPAEATLATARLAWDGIRIVEAENRALATSVPCGFCGAPVGLGCVRMSGRFRGQPVGSTWERLAGGYPWRPGEQHKTRLNAAMDTAIAEMQAGG